MIGFSCWQQTGNQKIWETCVCLFHRALISCFISSSTCGWLPAGLVVLVLSADITPLESHTHTRIHTEWITLGQTSHLHWSWIWSHKAVGICLKKAFLFFFAFGTIWYSVHVGNIITQFEKAEKNMALSKDQTSNFSLKVCTQRMFWTRLMELNMSHYVSLTAPAQKEKYFAVTVRKQIKTVSIVGIL